MDDQNYVPQEMKITIFSIKREEELKNTINKLRVDSPLILPNYFDSCAYSILKILEIKKSPILQRRPYTVAWAVVFSLLRGYAKAEIIETLTTNPLNKLYNNSKKIKELVGKREWQKFDLGKIEYKPDYYDDLKYKRSLRPSPSKILTELSKGPSYRRELSRKTNLRDSTVKENVNKLIAAGLVAEGQKSVRKKMISLTEEGERLVKERLLNSGTNLEPSFNDSVVPEGQL